jgi:Mg-chelatase subunit ChlD
MLGLIHYLRQCVLPSPRRTPTWWSATPLLAFLLAFGIVCLVLELNHFWVYTQLWPFALLVLAPWIWLVWLAGQNGLPPWRSGVAFLCRLMVLGLVVITLAEPRFMRKSDELTVVYTVDISDSIAPVASDQAREVVAKLSRGDKPEQDRSALVYFGRDAEVQVAPKTRLSTGEIEAVSVGVRRDGSDIAQALRLAAMQIPDGQNGRIVLVSDGAQTGGDLSGVLSTLRSKQIPVDVLPIDYTYEEEVWLDRLDLPPKVVKGQTYEAAVILSSLKAGRGKLILNENGQKLVEQEIAYTPGKNRYTLPIRLRNPGFYEYTAVVDPITPDAISQNNVAVNSLLLQGQGGVLLVTNPDGDSLAWEPLARLLQQADFAVQTISAYDLPSDSGALLPYDCLIFADVPREVFDETQLQSLHDAVFHQGLGFLMIGGPHSFGPGGWQGTLVEKSLPVDMDISRRKALLNGALVMVLDHSGSMGEIVPGTTSTKLQIANRAAIGAVETLMAKDWLGVVSFDTDPTWVVPFAPNSDAASATAKIRQIGLGGGTNMYPALGEALDAIQKLGPKDAAVKHIVLLTDGQSMGDPDEITKRCQEAQISISTIGIGDPSDVNFPLLGIIAARTNGRPYLVSNAKQLPRILIHEAVTLRRTAIRETPFTPEIAGPSVILKGIEALPSLQGMVLTVAKPRAEMVLATRSDAELDELDPVLAVQRYGVGRTAAFTSDLSSRWGHHWLQWDQSQAFVRQLITDIARTRKESSLQMEAYAQGTEGFVEIEDFSAAGDFLTISAVVLGPNKSSQSVTLQQVAPRRYRGQFELVGEGRYSVTAATSTGDRTSDAFVVPFSQEYLKFSANPSVLENIAAATGGRMLTGSETSAEIYHPDRAVKYRSRSIFDLLLIILSCLIPLDVALRRIQFDFASVWQTLKRPLAPTVKATSTATMSMLLRQKETLQMTSAPPAPSATERIHRPQPPISAVPLGSPLPSKTPAPPRAEPEKSAEESSSEGTFARLLKARKGDWKDK